MIRRKHFYILEILCLIFLFSLSGCGKEEKKKPQKTKDNTNEVVVTEEKQPQKTSEEKNTDEDGFYIVDDYVTPTQDVAEIMIKPSEGSGIYRYMTAGETVKRTGYNDIWSRILVDNTDFYVLTSQIEQASEPETSEEQTSSEEEDTEEEGNHLPKKVVIDAGNQAHENVISEPVGPDSQEKKRGATTGNVGTTYETKEYEINLVYAKLLQTELELRGYEVFLTRDSNDADMTNMERAQYANSSGATVLIRIQMGFSSNKELSGVMAMTMSESSPYNGDLYDSSNYLATRIIQGIILETGAANQGIYETEEMTVINWSKIPVAVIRPAFLSNSLDEANLLDEEYQAKLVKGMADGIDSYFSE
ncbi:MAG: N-acetylmuramoyl-L-alanine amidase [Clostridium sp.]|nr:N-acetylmuramoyl-L-alanine amidase [Clostridium sp.]MCM1399732.1 N-acetylmuramoyl-L-alanine amidase [Clostridium sp.]MCM1460433.1 N-acetylmuramoyl-L-alanine amidase [Bacteroides sp.]